MRKYVYLEFTDENVKDEFVDKIRQKLGEGINAVGIYESKEQLVSELSEELSEDIDNNAKK